ncbi:hypothetical protein AVEN_99760-1 [Araneus ventricosus]|uniref:Transposase Tc1-like domain-containing protein n=1 Tax=Araneus ventricosus TaxID=182803 RepID=A0A4Y2DM28_ARAVE|nr:hypothetical protein AVEN_99760-1 [Araneus ventricosus]
MTIFRHLQDQKRRNMMLCAGDGWRGRDMKVWRTKKGLIKGYRRGKIEIQNHLPGICPCLEYGREMQRFKKASSVEKKERSGRPRTFSEREERWIVQRGQVHINPRTSAVKSTLKCKSRFRKSVNPETVRNVLRKHKYHGRLPRRKPYISKVSNERLDWHLLKCT